MRTKLLFTLMASCFALGAAHAQPAASAPDSAGPKAATAAAGPQAGQKHRQHFSRLDKDQDGRISRAEAAGHKPLAEHFDAIDTNGDGQLSKEELAAWGKTMRQQAGERFDAAFKAADTNGDGQLSREEAAASKMPGLAQRFDRLDRNQDGQLSREELRAAHAAMHRGHGKQSRSHARPGHRGADYFQAADYNKDGVVSKAEALSYATALFDKMDVNGDGKLTREELRQGRMAGKEGKKGKDGGRNTAPAAAKPAP